MEFFNELKEDLEKLRERKNDLIWDDAQLQEQRERYSEAKAEFDDKYKDIGDNPFKQEKRGREEVPLMQQEQELINGEQELKRKKNQLSADFKDFVNENREWINKEKKNIKDRMENPINIEELKDRKASLETDRARYEERVRGWEDNNINPDDQIYVRLKQTLIPEIDVEIANIDKQIAEYRTNDEMSEDWDKLNEINGTFNKFVFESYEIDKLDDEIANLINLLEGKEEQTEELMQEPEQQVPSMQQPQPQTQPQIRIQPQSQSKKQPQTHVKPQSQQQSQTNSKIVYANQIKGIEVGTKGITITFKGKTPSQPITIPLKEVKDAYERKSEILKQNGITKEIEGLDPAIIQAFQSAKLAQGVSRDGIKRIQDLYMKSFEDNSEKSELLQGLITYNRSGLDYLKPSNIFKFIMNRKEYKQMREYANIAGKKEIATVVPDKKGPIRSFFDNRIKQLGNSNRDAIALPEAREHRNNDNDKGLRQELKVDYRGACATAVDKKNRAMGIDDPSGKLEQNSEQASTVAQEQDGEER